MGDTYPDWTPEKLLRFIQRGLRAGKIKDTSVLFPAEADIHSLRDIVDAVVSRLPPVSP